jgi:hypothetical protein
MVDNRFDYLANSGAALTSRRSTSLQRSQYLDTDESHARAERTVMVMVENAGIVSTAN